jgi:hypothetical protein
MVRHAPINPFGVEFWLRIENNVECARDGVTGLAVEPSWDAKPLEECFPVCNVFLLDCKKKRVIVRVPSDLVATVCPDVHCIDAREHEGPVTEVWKNVRLVDFWLADTGTLSYYWCSEMKLLAKVESEKRQDWDLNRCKTFRDARPLRSLRFRGCDSRVQIPADTLRSSRFARSRSARTGI